MAFPEGIVQSRTTLPPPVPARNHTFGSFWLVSQYLPLSSFIGFLSVGMDNTHCHHFMLHCPYVWPYGFDPGGKIVSMAWTDVEEEIIIKKNASPKTTEIALILFSNRI